MEKQVIFKCLTCENFNKTERFIQQETQFESLTAASEHLMETITQYNSGHYIYPVIIELKESK